MDVFGTTMTVLQKIYTITVFIRRVVADIDNYKSSKCDIHNKLEHEYLFITTFKDLFFEDSMKDDRFPLDLERDVENILGALKKSLTEYGLLAAKQVLLKNDNSQLNKDDGHQATISDPLPPENNRGWQPVLIDGSSTSKKDGTRPSPPRLRTTMKIKDFLKSANRALFDKDSITKNLAEYSEWTGRLRQTISLMLLITSTHGRSSPPGLAKSKRLEGPGLQDVIARQMFAKARAPADFAELPGVVTDKSESEEIPSIVVAKYDDGWGRIREVVAEYRGYDVKLIAATLASD
jgi:hypothetical protein